MTRNQREAAACAEFDLNQRLAREAAKNLAVCADVYAKTALRSVLEERRRQDAKWGEQNNDPFTYLVVLMEEVGELSEAALHSRFGGPAAPDLHKEAVQVAAVALAIVECLNRDKWQWPIDPPKP